MIADPAQVLPSGKRILPALPDTVKDQVVGRREGELHARRAAASRWSPPGTLG
jgi:hypothetical protein